MGFPPRDSIFDFLKFYPISIWRSITGFLAFGPLAGSLGTVMMALSVPGMIYLFQKDKFRLLVLISPLLMALALTTFYIYPYFHRTTYYASWPFLIFPFLGLMYLQQAVKWWKPMIANSIAVLIIILPVLVIANFIPHLPYEIEPIKKPLQIIQANRKPGDKVYVHHKGDLYMEYYGPKIGANDYVLGSDESLLSEEAYAHELKQFSGEPRVWYFYVGARPETNPEVNAAEIREMLDHKAEKIEEFDYPKGLYETFLILYDFTKK